MASQEQYDAIAQSYVEELRALTAPRAFMTQTERGERGAARGPVTATELVAQAEHLSTLSGELQTAAEGKLQSEEPAVKAEAATQLLAKALGDLEAGMFLLQAARDEEAGVLGTSAPAATERSRGATAGKLSEHHRILLGQLEVVSTARAQRIERGAEDAPGSAEQVNEAVQLTLFQISERATEAGQKTFEGLLALSLGEIGKAIGMIGANVAEHLGVAGKLMQLYDYFRGFVVKAYEAVLALLGPNLAKKVGEYVSEWWEDWRQNQLFQTLVEKLYETEATREYIAQKVSASQAAPDAFSAAAERVQKLGEEYKVQVRLAEKLLTGFSYVAGAAAGALPAPAGVLIVGAVYISLCGYIVLVGADYVDAQSVAKLGRLPGVRDVIEASL
ncbi:MAG TPA: hypothetical protein VF553_16450 [Pyrinomonadaceae bacterium]|jgi:hypothetical protein